MDTQVIKDSPLSLFLFSNTKMAWFWLVVRIYVGWKWLMAGLEKIQDPTWTGGQAGTAIAGFLKSAIQKASGAHPAVQGWYATFIQNVVLPHPVVWSCAIAYGELFVGIGLTIGAFTGIAAFFGLFMNLNYLLAGTTSTNPILFTLSIGIILAWKVAGYIGLDRYLLPLLGTPWQLGKVFKKSEINS